MSGCDIPPSWDISSFTYYIDIHPYCETSHVVISQNCPALISTDVLVLSYVVKTHPSMLWCCLFPTMSYPPMFCYPLLLWHLIMAILALSCVLSACWQTVCCWANTSHLSTGWTNSFSFQIAIWTQNWQHFTAQIYFALFHKKDIDAESMLRPHYFLGGSWVSVYWSDVVAAFLVRFYSQLLLWSIFLLCSIILFCSLFFSGPLFSYIFFLCFFVSLCSLVLSIVS